MQLEINTGGVNVVVSPTQQHRNNTDGRHKTDQDTSVPVPASPLVAMAARYLDAELRRMYRHAESVNQRDPRP